MSCRRTHKQVVRCRFHSQMMNVISLFMNGVRRVLSGRMHMSAWSHTFTCAPRETLFAHHKSPNAAETIVQVGATYGKTARQAGAMLLCASQWHSVQQVYPCGTVLHASLAGKGFGKHRSEGMWSTHRCKQSLYCPVADWKHILSETCLKRNKRC